MPPHDLSGHVHKIAAGVGLAGKTLHKGDVVTVGHKADILAVALVRVAELQRFRQSADGRFVHIPQRKFNVRQLFLVHHSQHIALIFFDMARFFQQPATRVGVLVDAGVMPRGQIIQPLLPCVLQQPAEFHRAVADNAGVGRAACLVGGDKIAYNVFAEFGGVIQHHKGHTQPLCNGGGVLRILGRTAGLQTLRTRFLVLVQAHHGTLTAVACLLHQVGCHRAVHAATHGNQCAGLL